MSNFFILAGVGALLVLAGLLIFWNVRRTRRDDLASADWPHVDGEIVKVGSSLIGADTSARSYYASYRYVVAGVTYKRTEVLGTGSGESIPPIAKMLSVGTKRQIYYNPAKPSVARISPGVVRQSEGKAWGYLVGFAVVGFMLIGFGLVFLTQ